MSANIRLTTTAACRVAGLDRDRFNEHVAAGRFSCAPATIAGRARLFDRDDMIALRLFRDLMNDGFDAATAGKIACIVSAEAKASIKEAVILYVEFYSGGSRAFCHRDVPAPKDWGRTLLSGSEIRKVTTFNIAKLRKLISEATEDEMSIVGPED